MTKNVQREMDGLDLFAAEMHANQTPGERAMDEFEYLLHDKLLHHPEKAKELIEDFKRIFKGCGLDAVVIVPGPDKCWGLGMLLRPVIERVKAFLPSYYKNGQDDWTPDELAEERAGEAQIAALQAMIDKNEGDGSPPVEWPAIVSVGIH